jgi:hypothetical protein
VWYWRDSPPEADLVDYSELKNISEVWKIGPSSYEVITIRPFIGLFTKKPGNRVRFVIAKNEGPGPRTIGYDVFFEKLVELDPESNLSVWVAASTDFSGAHGDTESECLNLAMLTIDEKAGRG